MVEETVHPSDEGVLNGLWYYDLGLIHPIIPEVDQGDITYNYLCEFFLFSQCLLQLQIFGLM